MNSNIIRVLIEVQIMGKLVQLALTPEEAYTELAKTYGPTEKVTDGPDTACPVCDTVCPACDVPNGSEDPSESVEGECEACGAPQASKTPQENLREYLYNLRKSRNTFELPLWQLDAICPTWRDDIANVPVRNSQLNWRFSHRGGLVSAQVYEVGATSTETFVASTLNLILRRIRIAGTDITGMGGMTASAVKLSGTLAELVPLIAPNFTEARLFSHLLTLVEQNAIKLSEVPRNDGTVEYRIVCWN